MRGLGLNKVSPDHVAIVKRTTRIQQSESVERVRRLLEKSGDVLLQSPNARMVRP
jgi:cysteine synthase